MKTHPERIRQTDKELVSDLNYDGVGFPVREKDFNKIERKTAFVLMCFVMKVNWLFQYTIEMKNLMDLLLVIDENKSHCVYIKGFDRFMFHKTKNKNKKYF